MCSLTAQERKEPEEPWLVGENQGIMFGKSPALVPKVKVLMPGVQVSLVPVVQILRFLHCP